MTSGIRSDWSRLVLVCAKCSKKVGGGFGDEGKTSLAKALRKRSGIRKGRKGDLGIVEVKCLGVCPKNAVTVVDGRDPTHWLLIRPKTPLDEVADMLDLPPPRKSKGP